MTARTCRYCGRDLTRHQGEDTTHYARRTHCNLSCAHSAKRGANAGANRPIPTDLPLAWQDYAACSGQDRELFFSDAHSIPDKQRVDDARAICQRCPVRADCLAFALASRSVGIWGGTTHAERQALKARQVTA